MSRRARRRSVVTASDRAHDAVRRVPSLTDHAGLLGVIAAEAAFAEGDGRWTPCCDG